MMENAAGSADPALPRFFTVEEANRTLPLVRRIVYDILEANPRLQRRLLEFDRVAADGEVAASRQRLQDLRQAIDEDAERINAFLAELHALGCLFKGFDEGLVDFYSMRDGRPVFLCWRLGEESVAHWHEIDAGFAGRQPLLDTP